MKVSHLRSLVEGMNPDDELMVLFWEKPEVFWDDELELTNEGWLKIVEEFEGWDGADQDICNWLADAVIDHSEIVDTE